MFIVSGKLLYDGILFNSDELTPIFQLSDDKYINVFVVDNNNFGSHPYME